MTEQDRLEQKEAIKARQKSEAMERLIPFITACPQIIKTGIGLESFVDELYKSAEKLHLRVDIINIMNNLLPLLEAHPQIIKQNIGLEEFVDDLIKAGDKYLSFVDIRRT